MQIKFIPALILFLGSYFPLSLIILLQDISAEYWERPICNSLKVLSQCDLPSLDNPGRSFSLFAITLLSMIFYTWLFKKIKGQHNIEILECRCVPNDLINYVFPYVVSFMTLEIGSAPKFYGFLIFIALMFLITYKSGQILMNPLLLLAGWNLYDIKALVGKNDIRDLRALSCTSIKTGDKLRSCVIQGIYVLFK